MRKIGQLTIIVYAIALFLGGLEGFITKHSVISLIASGLFAGLLAVAFQQAQAKPKFGLGLGALFVFLSFGRFASVFAKKHEMWPAGFYTIFGTIAVVIIGAAFLLEKGNATGPDSNYPV